MLINNAETLKWLEPPGSAGAKKLFCRACYIPMAKKSKPPKSNHRNRNNLYDQLISSKWKMARSGSLQTHWLFNTFSSIDHSGNGFNKNIILDIAD